MITKLLLVLKKLALPIVLFYMLVLTIASLIHLKNMPSIGSSFDDKIYHTIAYLILTLLVYNYICSKNIKNSIVISVVIAIVYGIIIEVMQYTLTTHRSFDIYDTLANTLGALIAVIVLKYLIKTKVKMN